MSSNPNEAAIAQHATLIGLLCIAWAALDRQLVELISAVTPVSKEVALIIAPEVIAQRCEMIKRLTFTRKMQEELRDSLTSLMDKIGQDIGKRRNRFVHDGWQIAEGLATRLDKRVFIRKPKSFSAAKLEYETRYDYTPEQVEDLCWEVSVASVCVSAAISDLAREASADAGLHPPVSPSLTGWLRILNNPANIRPANLKR